MLGQELNQKENTLLQQTLFLLLVPYIYPGDDCQTTCQW